jgi:hypothetical protein
MWQERYNHFCMLVRVEGNIAFLIRISAVQIKVHSKLQRVCFFIF